MKKYIILIILSLSCWVGIHAQTPQKMTYVYDALNRLTAVTYSNGSKITYNDDVLGNRNSVVIVGGCALPTAVLTGTQTITAGQTANILVTLTGVAPWSIVMNGTTYTASASPFSISVSPNTTTTYSLTSVSNSCGAGTVSGFATVTVNACTNMYTLKTGNWNDVTVWSCGRVPTSTDIVTVKASHFITIPVSYTANAKNVIFETGGKIIETANTSKLCLSCPQIPTNGLVLYIPFDGNTSDISGNNNNPVSTGTTSSVTDRKNQPLKAGGFGGVGNTGYHKIITNSSLQFTNGFSISGWYFLPSYYGMDGYGQASANGYNILLAKEGDRNGFYLGVSNNTTTNQQQINFTNNVSSGNNNFDVTATLTGTAASNLNKWIHLGITVANNEVKLFINGALTSNQIGIITNYTSMNAGDLYIGTMWALGISWYPYGGRLDELRIYNRALQDSEVLQIYNGEKP